MPEHVIEITIVGNRTGYVTASAVSFTIGRAEVRRKGDGLNYDATTSVNPLIRSALTGGTKESSDHV